MAEPPDEEPWLEDEEDGWPPLSRRRLPLYVRVVALLLLVLFVVAFPFASLIDGFYRGSYPELGLAAIELAFIAVLWWWLRGLRRG